MKILLLGTLALMSTSASASWVQIDFGGDTFQFTDQGHLAGPRIDLSTRFDTQDPRLAQYSFGLRNGSVCMEDMDARFDATTASTFGSDPYLTGQTRVELQGNPEGRPLCSGYFPLITVLPLGTDDGAVTVHMSSSRSYLGQDYSASEDPILDWLQLIDGGGYGWSTTGGVTSELVLDHFRISKVPEPGTLALFAMGLLGLLRARHWRLKRG